MSTRFTRDDLNRLGWETTPTGRLQRIKPRLAELAREQAENGPPKLTPKELTAVEKKWLAVLRERHPHSLIQPQFRVRVAAWDDPRPVHYTADFAVWTPYEGPFHDFFACTLWEAKDIRRKYHSDELTRPKMTRALNPWIGGVFLAAWDGTAWEERRLA